VLELVEQVKRDLDEGQRPDGYNVGFNAGTAAGQTAMHLHVHVMPRFHGDMDDPRGGVPSEPTTLPSSQPSCSHRGWNASGSRPRPRCVEAPGFAW
jgi:diadenosine tetraphosphate (Ap4A) HIT family hydrolase